MVHPTEAYFYDFAGNVLSETREDGTPLVDYVYLNSKLISKVTHNRAGDVYRDGEITLKDTILGLQTVLNQPSSFPLSLASDVNQDSKIGLAEIVHSLNVLANPSPTENELFFYDLDSLGTPVALSDTSGNILWQVDELPFGEEYQSEGNTALNKRRFIGKEKDTETGLLYFGARYMDDGSGRFTSPDPVGLVDIASGKINQEILHDPQRLNRYAYGLNNPYKYVDPDGEVAVLVIAAIAGAAWALDAAMPQSTDVPDSKGFLDHADTATMVAGVGSIKNVTKIPKVYKNYSQARNAALKWLKKRGFSADKKTIARLGDNKGKAIGMKTSDGKTGFRVEYDKRNKAHINVFAGKEKGPHFQFEGDRKTVNKIIKRFNKR